MSSSSLISILPPLKAESLQCIHRLQLHHRPNPIAIPKSRTASVAIVLFVGRLGDLYVLLSTRAGDLRSYASDTALPGGRYDPRDADEEETARREAYEEIGLPMDREKVRFICLLDQFLTGNALVVTPVVLLVTDNTISPILNPSEVTHLFSMPLSAFLVHRPSLIPNWSLGISDRIHPLPPELVPPPPLVRYAEGAGQVGGKEGAYYAFRDVQWGEGTVRMHRFLTGREGRYLDGTTLLGDVGRENKRGEVTRSMSESESESGSGNGGVGRVKPVYGLTSAILIHAAKIGCDRPPTFPIFAPGQRNMSERIRWAMSHDPTLRKAIEQESSRAKL